MQTKSTTHCLHIVLCTLGVLNPDKWGKLFNKIEQVEMGIRLIKGDTIEVSAEFEDSAIRVNLANGALCADFDCEEYRVNRRTGLKHGYFANSLPCWCDTIIWHKRDNR